ncbi:MAG: hypothetical protein WDM80_08220 [Limisphaerales bacterium]
MSTEDSISKTVAVAVPKLVGILTPLAPEGRKRAIASAMMVFGETTPLQKTRDDDNEDQKKRLVDRRWNFYQSYGLDEKEPNNTRRTGARFRN